MRRFGICATRNSVLLWKFAERHLHQSPGLQSAGDETGNKPRCCASRLSLWDSYPREVFGGHINQYGAVIASDFILLKSCSSFSPGQFSPAQVGCAIALRRQKPNGHPRNLPIPIREKTHRAGGILPLFFLPPGSSHIIFCPGRESLTAGSQEDLFCDERESPDAEMGRSFCRCAGRHLDRRLPVGRRQRLRNHAQFPCYRARSTLPLDAASHHRPGQPDALRAADRGNQLLLRRRALRRVRKRSPPIWFLAHVG